MRKQRRMVEVAMQAKQHNGRKLLGNGVWRQGCGVALLSMAALLSQAGAGLAEELKLQHWPSGVNDPVSFEWEGKRSEKGIEKIVQLSFTYREGGIKKEKYYTFCKGKGGKVQLGFVNGGRKDTGIKIPVYHCIYANDCSPVNGGVRIEILGDPKTINGISKNARVKYVEGGSQNVSKINKPKVKFVVLRNDGLYYPAVFVYDGGRGVDYYNNNYYSKAHSVKHDVCETPPKKQVVAARAGQNMLDVQTTPGSSSGGSVGSSRGNKGGIGRSSKASESQMSSSSGSKQKGKAYTKKDGRISIVLIDDGNPVREGQLAVAGGTCTSASQRPYKKNGQWTFLANELPEQSKICVAYKAPGSSSPACITWYRPAGFTQLTVPKPTGSCEGELKFTIQVGGQALHQAELDLLARKLQEKNGQEAVSIVAGASVYLIAKASKEQVKSWLEPYFKMGQGVCQVHKRGKLKDLCVFQASGRKYVHSVRLELRRAGTDQITADCLPRLHLGNTDCGRMEAKYDQVQGNYYYSLDLANHRQCNQLILGKDVDKIGITFDKPDDNASGAKQCQLKTGKLTLAHLQGKEPLDVKEIQPRVCVFHVVAHKAGRQSIDKTALKNARSLHIKVLDIVKKKKDKKMIYNIVYTNKGWKARNKLNDTIIKEVQDSVVYVNNATQLEKERVGNCNRLVFSITPVKNPKNIMRGIYNIESDDGIKKIVIYGIPSKFEDQTDCKESACEKGGENKKEVYAILSKKSIEEAVGILERWMESQVDRGGSKNE